MIEFESQIAEAAGGGAYVEVPADVIEKLGGGGRIPVKASFDGVPYSGSIVRMGGVTCIGVLKSIRRELGKGPGDSVVVAIDRDDSVRTVEVPPELKAIFAEQPDAEAIFLKLSFSHQREHVNYIREAKKPETRRRRAARTIENLRS